MVNLEESVPQKSESYLNAQSVFFVQFNEIEFYFEDEHHEELYFVILKKILLLREKKF